MVPMIIARACTRPASTAARAVQPGLIWSRVHLLQKGCGMYSSVIQFEDGSIGVQWDDAHEGAVTHAGLANETFVRLQLQKRSPSRATLV